MDGVAAVIRAHHRTMYFDTKETAEEFLKSTKSWKIEEPTEKEKQAFKVGTGRMVERLSNIEDEE